MGDAGVTMLTPQWTSDEETAAALAVSAARLLFDTIDTDSGSEITKKEFDSWASANPDKALVFMPGAKKETGDAQRNLKMACIKFRLGSDDNDDGVLDVDEFTAAYVAAVVAEAGAWSCAPNDGWMA